MKLLALTLVAASAAAILTGCDVRDARPSDFSNTPAAAASAASDSVPASKLYRETHAPAISPERQAALNHMRDSCMMYTMAAYQQGVDWADEKLGSVDGVDRILVFLKMTTDGNDVAGAKRDAITRESMTIAPPFCKKGISASADYGIAKEAFTLLQALSDDDWAALRERGIARGNAPEKVDAIMKHLSDVRADMPDALNKAEANAENDGGFTGL